MEEKKSKAAVLDLLRSWEHTNQYEKSYFLLLHVMLFLLGLYFIRSKSWKKLARPVRHSTKQDDEEGSLHWANNLANWLMKNGSVVHQAMDNWRLKLNGRLLKNSSKGNFQIVEINYESLDYKIIDVKSLDSNIENEMNISISVLLKRLELNATQSSVEKKTTIGIILQDLSPEINILLSCLHGKIKVSYKLAGFSLSESQIEFKDHISHGIDDIKSFKDAMNAAAKDSMVLEATRGILKKEIKTERNQKNQNLEDIAEDSPKHILVTDIDSAMAKFCSNEIEKHVEKTSDEETMKPHLLKPDLKACPVINVLPATPVSEGTGTSAADPFAFLLAKAEESKKKRQEDANQIEVPENPMSPLGVFVKTSEHSLAHEGVQSDQRNTLSDKGEKKEHEVGEVDKGDCGDESNDSDDENRERGGVSNDADNKSYNVLLAGKDFAHESNGIYEKSRIIGDKSNDNEEKRDDVVVADKNIDRTSNDINEKSEDVCDKRKNIADKEDRSDDIVMSSKDNHATSNDIDDKDKDTGNIGDDIGDTNSDVGNEDSVIEDTGDNRSQKTNDVSEKSPEAEKSFQEEWGFSQKSSLRPKSICSGELKKLPVDDTYHEVRNKRSKNEIGRVNTFHLGSKSMASIINDERSPAGYNLRSASQLSLSSPVGYSVNKPSALIIETDEKKYYHIPPAMVKKGNYNKTGTKLHVYNGHVFVAQHFNKIPPSCSVCSLPLTRRIGKQGYQCRDCKTVTHKRCHNHIKHSCQESSFPSLQIEYLGSTDV